MRLLRSVNYRDLKVTDIAREAGTSPATFYQYFGDVEAAVLALAEQLAERGNEQLNRLVRDTTWTGRRGTARRRRSPARSWASGRTTRR
ncbi:MAG: helix-turn-helix domain-containing protein [Microthrixaceae bacterium]